MKFEVVSQEFHFDIKYAVYPEGCDSSLCYCDTQNRAELISRALEFWALHHPDWLSATTEPKVE